MDAPVIWMPPPAFTEEDENELLLLVPICGCGGDALYAEWLTLLEHADTHIDRCLIQLIDERGPLFEALVHCANHLDLIEHGGNARGSWRTGTGDRALELLRKRAAAPRA